MRNMCKHQCNICSKPFETYRKTSKYCSIKCQGVGASKEYADGSRIKATQVHTFIPCEFCKKDFYQYEYHIRFCSNKCARQVQEVTKEARENRSKSFYRRIGIEPISKEQKIRNKSERSSRKYQKVRAQVLDRDNHTCKACLSNKGSMHIHHIKNFLINIEERYNLENLITLCPPCHRKIKTFKEVIQNL